MTISSSTVTVGKKRKSLTKLEARLALSNTLAVNRFLFDFLLEELANGDVLPAEVVGEAESDLVAVATGWAHNENAAG